MFAVQLEQTPPTFSSHFSGASDTFKRVGADDAFFVRVCVFANER